MGQVTSMPAAREHEETVLERAVRLEIKRISLIESVGSSHRTAGSATVTGEGSPKAVPQHLAVDRRAC